MNKKALIIGGIVAIILIVVIAVVVSMNSSTKNAPEAVVPEAVVSEPLKAESPTTPVSVVQAPVVSVDPPYNKVKYFRVQRVKPNGEAENGKNIINIAELEFYNENGEKVPASNILNVSYNDGGVGFNPFAAVNGIMDDFAHTTNSPDAYIQVAFKEPVLLSKAVITNRTSCCKQRMIGTQVQTYPTEGSTPYTKVDIIDARDIYTINYSRNSLPSLNTDNVVKGSNGWSLVKGIPVAGRLNQNGDFECASNNARDCLWRNSESEVLADINNASFNPTAPLSCGQGHKSAWGGSGYQDGNHWCVKGLSQLNPTSTKINPMPSSFIRYTRNRNNYLQY